MNEVGDRISEDINDVFRVVGGFEGELLPKHISDTWRWRASAQYGRTNTHFRQMGLFLIDRTQTALGPSFQQNGQRFCGTPDAPIAGCVPLDILHGANSISPEMADYIAYAPTISGFNQSWSTLATANGRLVKTPWGGDIRAAVGGEYRQESGGSFPDDQLSAQNVVGNKTTPVEGSFSVREAFAELSVVPVTGQDWAKWVEANASMRVFNYSNFGTDYTWKVGGIWKVSPGISLRGTYSTAFRAPTVNDLFSGNASGFPFATDPCDAQAIANNPTAQRNCATPIGKLAAVPNGFTDTDAQHQSTGGGNPKLKPEKADIFTAGIIFEPTFVNNLAFTTDLYNVKVRNSIDTPSAQAILNNCYLRDDRRDCDKIQRGSNGKIENILTNLDNITDGGEETTGIDFGAVYAHTTPIGAFRYSAGGNYVLLWNKIRGDNLFRGAGVLEPNIGYLPRLRMNYYAVWAFKQFGAGTNVRYIHSATECENKDCSPQTVTDDSGAMQTVPALSRTIPVYVTADLFGEYRLKTQFGISKFAVGVNNLLDKTPPFISGGDAFATDAETYDFMGRFIYVRMTQTY
jgi:outer membrane receptor protein involved in Fe transport